MTNETTKPETSTAVGGLVDPMDIYRILDRHLIKPENYYFVCGGGGSAVRMVDVMQDSPNYTCRFQGDKNWMTPACEKCTGLKQEEKALRDNDSTHNAKLKIFAEAIIAELGV